MRLKEVIEVMEQTYPLHYALEWDNVGLLVGQDVQEIQRIYVALDATEEVVTSAIDYGADMLITHHPLIFTALKKINSQNMIGNRLLKLIQNNISCYALHTNYDVLRMSELSAEAIGLMNADILKVTYRGQGSRMELIEGIGRIAVLEDRVSLSDYCNLVKKSFGLDHVKVFDSGMRDVRKVAIAPGAGAIAVEDAINKGADVLVTGDIDHHTGIDAAAKGLHVIDAGHYGIEHIFIRDMRNYLSDTFTGVEVMEAPIVHPFRIL